MVTLYYNYLGQKTAVVSVFIYGSLAITLVSAFHYLLQVLRMGREPEEGIRRLLRQICPRKYSSVFVSPSSRPTFGSHFNSVRARVMSGWRTFGSSSGSGR